MVIFLKGDKTAEITLALADGFDYSGKTVHLEYQGARRSFSNAVAGGALTFSFSAAETAPMSLGTYPVRVWIEDAQGEKTTIHNSAAKFRVTDCATDIREGGAVYLDVRGGLYGIDGLPPRFTDNDLRDKVNEILRRLGGTVAMFLLCALPAFAASITVQTAPKGEVYNDEAIVTNVTLDVSDLATSASLNERIAAVNADIAAKAGALKYVGTNSYELADCDWVCEWDGTRLEGDGETWVLRQDDLGRALICGHAFGKLGTIYYEWETVGTNRVGAVYYLPIYHPSDRQYDPNPEYTLYLDNFNELVFDTLTDGTPAPAVRRLVRTGRGWNLEYPVVYKDSFDALADRVNSRLETKADAEQASVVTNAAEWRVQRMNVHIALSLYNRTSDYWNDTYFMRKVNMWHAAGPPTKLWVWDSGDQYFRLGWYDPAEHPYGVNGYIAEWHFTGGDAHYLTAPSAEDEGLLGFVDNVTAEWVVETAIVTNKVVYSDTTDALSAHVATVAGELSEAVAKLEDKKAEKYIFEVGDAWVDDDTGHVYERLQNSRVWTNETTQAYIEWRENGVPAIEHDGAWFFVLPRIGDAPPELFAGAFGYMDDSHVTFYNSDEPSEATDIRQFTRTYPVVTNTVNYIRIEYDANDGRPILYSIGGNQ